MKYKRVDGLWWKSQVGGARGQKRQSRKKGTDWCNRDLASKAESPKVAHGRKFKLHREKGNAWKPRCDETITKVKTAVGEKEKSQKGVPWLGLSHQKRKARGFASGNLH